MSPIHVDVIGSDVLMFLMYMTHGAFIYLVKSQTECSTTRSEAERYREANGILDNCSVH